jgi:hypothetical protein
MFARPQLVFSAESMLNLTLQEIFLINLEIIKFLILQKFKIMLYSKNVYFKKLVQLSFY